MIPANTLSNPAHFRPWREPVRGPREYLVDYEVAGVAINDGMQGMEVKQWECRVAFDKDDDGVIVESRIDVSAPGVPWTTLVTRSTEVTEVCMAFDNNMNPFIGFIEANGNAYRWWFDSLTSTQELTLLPAGTKSVRCCVDEKRRALQADTDIIFSFIRGGDLYVGYQRERYTTDHLMQAGLGANAEIVAMQMNKVFRLQWHLRDTNPIPGALVVTEPFLGDVVKDLSIQSGIPVADVNVSELYFDTVSGLKIDSDDGLTKPIDQLRQVFHFDKAEYDRKIHFPKRGRDIVALIPASDLVRGNPIALKQQRDDESKLAREVNVNHLDPDGGFAKNKQYAQRRSNLVNARAKKNVDTQVVLTVDQAATAAVTLLRIDWNEQIEYKFSTTIKWTELTPCDVVEVEDLAGTWHRMRLEERNEDGNVIAWEGRQDAGARTYGKVATGNSIPPPTSTTPGITGETQLEIIDASPLLDQDDELGLYIAAAGVPNSSWTGYQLLVSIDGGVSYQEAFRGEAPSTIGDSVTDVANEAGHDITSTAEVEVTVNFPLASVTPAQILTGQNRFCLGDEIGQFETAALLGMVGPLYHYKLSGLRRAKYGSVASFWPAGTRFVLIDETVAFVRAQRAMVGLDLHYKAVSYGRTEDETVATAYLFDDPASQTEWAPVSVASSRDAVTNDVVVTWAGRPRLGQFGTPFHSKYFRGYRVTFSDAHTVDTLDQVVSYPNAPVGVTVQVQALNEITGAGPASAPVAT